MKPNFALSLSFKGIQLLQRATDGWRLVGDVSLETADLKTALAELRHKAQKQGVGSIRTKLVIPDDQIKYLTLDSGSADLETRRQQARAALDGATPYLVSELVYDVALDGATTYVAAVARDTLKEAEAFAVEHDFGPTSFVAAPDADNIEYLGEPFFGPTQWISNHLMAGDEVDPDGIAVVNIGPAEPPKLPEPEKFTDPEASEPTDSSATGFSSVRGPNSAEAAKSAPVVAKPPKSSLSSGSIPIPEVTPPAEPKSERRLSLNTPPAIPPAKRVGIDLPPTAEPDTGTSRGDDGYLAKRQPKKDPAVIAAVPLNSEQDRQNMTIFGARDKPSEQVGGKPRFLGAYMTGGLLACLAGFGVWAMVTSGNDDVQAPEIAGNSVPEVTDTIQAPAPLAQNDAPAVAPVVPEVSEDAPSDSVTAALVEPEQPTLSDTDNAVLEALAESPQEHLEDPIAEVAPLQETPAAPEIAQQADTTYAVTGIWQEVPATPVETTRVAIDDVYIASIDPRTVVPDIFSPPPAVGFLTDTALEPVAAPPPAGTSFKLDERGLVIASPEGTVNPDGVIIFLGRPDIVPPATPERSAEVAVDPTAEPSFAPQSPDVRPRLRPANLVEQNERGQLGGFSRNELASLRPQVRPLLERTVEEATVEAEDTATELAVVLSPTPTLRPNNFAATVERSRAAAATQPAEVTQVAAVAPRTVAPKIPSSTTSARAATVKNVLNLRKVNLLGVSGKPSARRALVRMANGRVRQVSVGDRIDGGRVVAIGDSELRYTKGSRNLVLKMPRG